MYVCLPEGSSHASILWDEVGKCIKKIHTDPLQKGNEDDELWTLDMGPLGVPGYLLEPRELVTIVVTMSP